VFSFKYFEERAEAAFASHTKFPRPWRRNTRNRRDKISQDPTLQHPFGSFVLIRCRGKISRKKISQDPRNFKPLHITRPTNPLPSDAIPVRQVAAACRSGDLDLVIELVAGQNRSAHVLNHGLYAAIQAGHEPVARYLLENGVEMTPLVIEYATKSKSIAIFRLLMDHGWKVNDPTRNGRVLFP
jgi:hypothetical protein